MISFLRRIQWWLQRRRKEDELREELEFHLAEEASERRAHGIAENEAKWAARRDLGSTTRVREEVRGLWSWRLLEELAHDIRYTLRGLRRDPGFAATAILALALGIGATTTIFTLIDGILLKPLPFPRPDELVLLQPTSGSRLSPRYFDEWRRESRAFDDMAAWLDARLNLTGEGLPLEVPADRATTNFFDVLGTPPMIGRSFSASPDLAAVEPEIVLSHGFWQRHFGADVDVVGRSLTLNGEVRTIVGIMPPGFTVRTTELSESRAEVWVPYRLAPGQQAGMGGVLNVVGRLAPEATVDSAQAELATIAARLEEERPSYSRDWRITVVPLLVATVKDVRAILLALFGAVGLLLLVACGNVANLSITRTSMREPEFVVRLSLGASADRLIRQLATESAVLSLLGGVLGILVAMSGIQIVLNARPSGLDLPRAQSIAVDMRVVLFSLSITAVTAVLAGVWPSLRLLTALAPKAVGTGRGSTRRVSRLSNVLIVAEVVMATIVLAGAVLLVRSYRNLTHVDPGFRPERVLTMRTALPDLRYRDDQRVRAFGDELLQRIPSVPGVQAVGFANYLPMSRSGAASPFAVEGQPERRPEDQRSAWVAVVGGQYFDALGIPLLRGRLPNTFDSADTQPVFLIDEQLARIHWPDGDPIGDRLIWNRANREPLRGTVIGIVGSVRYGGLAARPVRTAYWWYQHIPIRQLNIVVRTTDDPAGLGGAVAAEVARIDPQQPVGDIRPMQDFIADDLAQPRFTMTVVGVFAAAALVLAVVGLFGVMAFRVTQRTREIGIRMALGSGRADVLWSVLANALVLVGIGLTIGLAAAVGFGRLGSSLLFGVTPTDSATLIAVVILVGLASIVGAYLPARRAARVDPTIALRCE